MKYLMMTSLSIFFALISSQQMYGQLPPSPTMSSSTQGMSSPDKDSIHSPAPLKPLQPAAKPSTPASSEAPALPTIKPPTPIVQKATYLHPGILVSRNGTWEGSDHLLNVSNNIGVYVTLLKPEKETLEFTEDHIKKEIEAIFEKANIKPITLAPADQPALPAFEMEFLIYPVEKGYVACCSGRLFESVTLSRFILEPGMAFQAITWEKQSLVVSPKAQFQEQLIKNVQEIAQTFADRFQVYEKLKSEIKH